MNIIVTIISNPGILNGKQQFGFNSFGKILDDTSIVNFVRYIVNPIGIKTTIPVMK